MRFLLDTNVVIPFLNGRNPRIVEAVHRQRMEDLCLSSLVLHELFFGAYRSARVEHSVASLHALPFAVLSFDRDDAAEAGRLRELLAARGQTIGPYDVLIAGQALQRGLTVVTANLREFEWVPGLRCEDWSR